MNAEGQPAMLTGLECHGGIGLSLEGGRPRSEGTVDHCSML